MRFLVVSEPSPTPPPMEMFPMLLQAFKGWREKWRPKMEAFEFFAGRSGGGWGVVNVADEKELSQFMIEYPWGPFSSTQCHPTTNGDEALERLIAQSQQMMAAMQNPGG